MKVHIIVALICGVFYRQVSCGVVITADQLGASKEDAEGAISEIQKAIDGLSKADEVDGKITAALDALLTELEAALSEPKQKIDELVAQLEQTECYKPEDLDSIPNKYKGNLEAELDLSEQKGKISAETVKCAAILTGLNEDLTACDAAEDDKKEECYQGIVDGKDAKLGEVNDSEVIINGALVECDTEIDKKKEPQLSDGKIAITEKASSVTKCLIGELIDLELAKIPKAQEDLGNLKTNFDDDIKTAKDDASTSISAEIENWKKIYEDHKTTVQNNNVNIDECLIEEGDLTKLPETVGKNVEEAAKEIVAAATKIVTDGQTQVSNHNTKMTTLKDELGKCVETDSECITKVEGEFNTEQGKTDVSVLVTEATSAIDKVDSGIKEKQSELEGTTKTEGEGKATSIDACISKVYYDKSQENCVDLNEAVSKANADITEWTTKIVGPKIDETSKIITPNITTTVDNIKTEIAKLEVQAKDKDADITKCLETKPELDVIVTNITIDLATEWATKIDETAAKLKVNLDAIAGCVSTVNIEAELTKCLTPETVYNFDCINEFFTKTLKGASSCKGTVDDNIKEAEKTVGDEISSIGNKLLEAALTKAQTIGDTAKTCIKAIINGGLIAVPSILIIAVAASIQFMFNN